MDAERRPDIGRLLIACALRGECNLLIREANLIDTPVIATGLGADRTRKTLNRILPDRTPSLLVFTGTAGALDPSLSQGDVVFPEVWMLEGGGSLASHPPTVAWLNSCGWSAQGIGWTARAPVCSWEERRRLFRQTGARICDMEAASALETAHRLGIPAIALKVVADPAVPGSPPLTVKDFRAVLPKVISSLAQAVGRLLADLSRRPE